MLDAWKDLLSMEKGTFKIIPHMMMVTQHIRKLYENFKPYLPLINDLRNPGLKKRHLKIISERLGVDIDEEMTVPL